MSTASKILHINPFRRWWDLGYRKLVPIVPPGAPVRPDTSLQRSLDSGIDPRGKAPGVKGDDGLWSGMKSWLTHETTEEDLDRWFAMGAGVGVRTGDQGNGFSLVMVDADTTHLDRAGIIKDMIEKVLGLLPVRIGRYPKAGYLALVEGLFKYSRIDFGEAPKERVEILSDGKQFVTEGVHPVTMQPYRWPNEPPAFADLPIVEAEALTQLLEDLRPLLPASSPVSVEGGSGHDVDQNALKGDPAIVRQAVEATPNTTRHFPSRNEFVAFGYMIKGATQDDPQLGLELYQDWAARWIDPPPGDENAPDYAAMEWRKMKAPFKSGAPLLYETAERLSGGKFHRGTQWLDEPEQEDLFGEKNSSKPLEASKRKALTFVSLDEAADHALTASAAPLIKGLLDQGAMTVLYGASNSGKTFIAMDLAYHVASGRPWGGMKAARLGTAYVLAEGGGGGRKRLAALRAKYGSTAGFHVLLQSVDLLRPDADLGPLVAALRALPQPLGLVTLDTLSRIMAGGDENASTDMGALVRNLDVLRQATGAHVLVVHHSGKDQARGARGHSLLRAATDTEIEIADRVVRVTKQRDLDGTFSSAFVLDVVGLGMDGEGDPVTSCTVRLVSEAEVAAVEPVAPTAGESRILDVLSALADVARDPEKGISPAEIAAHFAKGSDIVSAGNVRAVLGELIIKRQVVRVGRGRYLKKGQSVRLQTQENASCVGQNGQNVFG